MIDQMFSEAVERVETALPRHACGLYLSHNAHKDIYTSLADEEARAAEMNCAWNWVSEEQRLKAIEADECWSLQWYPDTPVGSFTIHAHDLPALLEYVATNENFA